MILVHLVSEQTLQNLLPTLGLRPQAILQVRSGDTRFDAVPVNLEKACRVAGLHEVEFLPVETIPTPSPTVEETEAVLNGIQARYAGRQICVNLTGGTKLMSIGAHRFAEYHRLPSLYTDTQNHRAFVDGNTGVWPGPLPDLKTVVDGLSIPAVLAAQGKAFHEQTISNDLLEFGRRSWELHEQHHAPLCAWTGNIRKAVPRTQGGKVKASLQELQAFLTRPLPSPASPAAEQYLDLAVAAGLIRVDTSGRAFLTAKASRQEVERCVNLLEGGWLELAVAAFAREGARFKEVHWSLAPEETSTPADYGETDLVMLDRAKLQVAIVSCKAGLTHVSMLEHLSSWRDRARTLGGSHASAHLCIFDPGGEERRLKEITKMGKNMGISIHAGGKIPQYFRGEL